jgi:hypothetical protein
METYQNLRLANEKSENGELLKRCAVDVNELMEALALMSDNRKSPFVIYVNDFSEFR